MRSAVIVCVALALLFVGSSALSCRASKGICRTSCKEGEASIGVKTCINGKTCCSKSGSGSVSTTDTGSGSGSTSGYNNFRDENSKAHNTDKYRGNDGKPQKEAVILRRFQEFKIGFPAQYAGDGVEYSLKHAKGSIKLTKKSASNGVVTLVHDQSPVAIGTFELVAKKGSSEFKATDKFIFLFNPWSDKDDVYVSSAHSSQKFGPSIKEHVLNELGVQFQGSDTSYSWMPWAYNQFDMSALRVTLGQLSDLSLKQLASVELVSRWLTMRGSNVLRGRWDGEYSDGKEPWTWSTTTEITAQYEKTGRTVRYGQCWVFAGLLTTFMRTLGVPSTSMSNFNSAHESRPSDGKYKLECKTFQFEDSNGDVQEDESKQTCSVWNFHVWVDAWFKRPGQESLPHYWQAIDATPQESSDMGPKETPFNQDAYFCGPASIAQMNQGQYDKAYDSAFVGGESNAKLTTYYKRKGESSYRLVSTDTSHVGELMLSKLRDDQCNGAAADADGYFRVCKENKARLYSKTGSFLEQSEDSKAFTFTVSGNNKNGFIELGVTHKAKISPANVGGAKKVSWSISAVAVSNNGTILGKVDSKKGVYDVAKGPSRENIMELPFGAATWKKPEVLALLKKTDSIKFLFVAKPDGKDPTVGFKFATYRAKPLTLECGSKTQKVGSITCTVIASSRVPTTLTGVKVTLEVTGQGTDQEKKALSSPVTGQDIKGEIPSFLEESEEGKPRTQQGGSETTMGKGAVRFENLKVDTTRAGEAIVIATLTSNELPANKGFFYVTLTE